MLFMLVQYNAVPVYIYGITGSFRLSFYMLIYKAHIFILSVCVDDKYNVYMYILTSDILSSQVCHGKGYTICSLCGGACRYLTLVLYGRD